MARPARGRGGATGEVRIGLLVAVDLLHECLTEAVCGEVFGLTRITERVRDWTLHQLAEFWTAVILRAPASLTGALAEAQQGLDSGWPAVPATTKQSFFERCQNFRPDFFANLYRALRDRLLAVSMPVFCDQLSPLLKHFSSICAIDGSRLDVIAHWLKILWDVRSPILPGCLEVVYDLTRGIPRAFHFNPDAAAAEIGRARGVLDEVPPGTLLLGDRLYATADFFERIAKTGIYGLFRRWRGMHLRKVKRLSQSRIAGGVLEDWLVDAGSGHSTPVQRLRWIRWRKNGITFELLSNVLDPRKLPADLAWGLYPYRWSIERMFYDLKEVLNLNCFYTGNPNAVAMQVYAAAMVYTAFRVAQGRSARDAGITPEEISPEKFFPRVASMSATWTGIQIGMRTVIQMNPGRRLRLPNWRRRRFASIPLSAVRVERRNSRRRKRRFCASRARWKSFKHVRGGRALLKN